MLETMAWTDVAAVALLIIMGLHGLMRGAIRTVIGVAAILGGLFLASRYGGELGMDALPGVRDAQDPSRVGVVLGGLVIVLAAVLVGGLLGRMLRKLAEQAELGRFDRGVGLLLGLAKGTAVAAVLCIALMSLGPPALQDDARRSHAAGLTRDLVEVVAPLLPAEAAEAARDAVR